ncbi:hypothetical protein LguiB_010435 [Lonicera macranthoides]
MHGLYIREREREKEHTGKLAIQLYLLGRCWRDSYKVATYLGGIFLLLELTSQKVARCC